MRAASARPPALPHDLKTGPVKRTSRLRRQTSRAPSSSSISQPSRILKARSALGLLRFADPRLRYRARPPHQLRKALAPRALECGDTRPQRLALLMK